MYAAILSLIVLGAGARLALFPPQATLVRVAGLCIIGLVALTGLAVIQSRNRRSAAGADARLPEPQPTR